MKKLILSLVFLFSITAYGQVGINTPTPTTTLDVNGDVRIRSTITNTNANNLDLLLSNSTGVVSKITTANFVNDLKIPSNIFNAEQTSDLATNLSGNNTVNKVIFGTVNLNVAGAGTWNTTNNTYTVAKKGIYHIVSGVLLTNVVSADYVERIYAGTGPIPATTLTVGGIFLSGNNYSINGTYVKLLDVNDVIYCTTNTGSTSTYRQGKGFLHIIYTPL